MNTVKESLNHDVNRPNRIISILIININHFCINNRNEQEKKQDRPHTESSLIFITHYIGIERGMDGYTKCTLIAKKWHTFLRFDLNHFSSSFSCRRRRRLHSIQILIIRCCCCLIFLGFSLNWNAFIYQRPLSSSFSYFFFRIVSKRRDNFDDGVMP